MSTLERGACTGQPRRARPIALLELLYTLVSYRPEESQVSVYMESYKGPGNPCTSPTGSAPVHALDGAEPPRPQQRRDTRGPRPFAHAVETFASRTSWQYTNSS